MLILRVITPSCNYPILIIWVPRTITRSLMHMGNEAGTTNMATQSCSLKITIYKKNPSRI